MLTVESASLARLFPDVASGHVVRPRLPILRYRSLDERGSALSLPPDVFRWQMRQLLANGWRVLGPDGLLNGLDGGWLARSTAITFDEGYRNFREHALPILHGYAFAAIVFAACGGPRAATPPGQPATLDWSELRALARDGITLGLRVPAEPDLRLMSPAQAEATLMAMQHDIEDHLEQPVTVWAHAYGRLPGWLEPIAQRRFRAGFGTRLGSVRASGHVSALERVDARLLRDRRVFRALGSRWLDAYLNARQALRDLHARPG